MQKLSLEKIILKIESQETFHAVANCYAKNCNTNKMIDAIL